jgi:hypothetical protein
MLLIAACAALVAVGIVIVVRWGSRPPADDAEPGFAGWLRYGGGALAAGAVAGLPAAGPGGRLVMRPLALTSPDAEGEFTEAGETIGEITVDGTLGFVIFTGLAAGLLVALGGRLARLPAAPAIGRRAIVAGRVAVALLSLVALPAFVTSVADILE